MKKKKESIDEKMVREWNEKYPIKTLVTVTKDDSTEIYSQTTSIARIMCGCAVIHVKDISGCYALDRVKAI